MTKDLMLIAEPKAGKIRFDRRVYRCCGREAEGKTDSLIDFSQTLKLFFDAQGRVRKHPARAFNN